MSTDHADSHGMADGDNADRGTGSVTPAMWVLLGAVCSEALFVSVFLALGVPAVIAVGVGTIVAFTVWIFGIVESRALF